MFHWAFFDSCYCAQTTGRITAKSGIYVVLEELVRGRAGVLELDECYLSCVTAFIKYNLKPAGMIRDLNLSHPPRNDYC